MNTIIRFLSGPALALTLVCCNLYAGHAPVHHFVKLEHWALGLVDGKTPGFDGNTCLDCLQVRGLINDIMRGKFDPITHTFVKTYQLDGQKVALEELVALEQKLTKGTPAYERFNKCLSHIKEDFMAFTGPLLGSAEIARKTNILLIEEWCEKAPRHDSMLLNWGKINEREELRKATALQFFVFLNDLKGFLHDLMFNCPKGRNLFKQERLSLVALKEAFAQSAKMPGSTFEAKLNEVIEEHVQAEYRTNGITEADLLQWKDRRKKGIFANSTLSPDVIEALEKCNITDIRTFEATFRKIYETKCTRFDSSFAQTTG